ncbi:hypothetical protein BS50DRAFT_569034 [Corynespora cassiicola Philippines]|uniref:Ras guanyl-nucleotide exchange factor RasGEF n=1 Tax=Corynespora cassiicola Philippines TaxID=1448308 RepID=A0A2T2P7D6_CORCC|nr:hypothetical protein BS50DRAFT_569034 [Corynespora cassiicola Philippines]
MAQPQLRSLYRRLLRELPTRPSPSARTNAKLASPSPLQKRLRETLSGAQKSANGQKQQQHYTDSQIAQAEQFVQYVQAQRMYATLIERYNPGMGMSEEERVRLTARRVGMDLPVEFGKE